MRIITPVLASTMLLVAGCGSSSTDSDSGRLPTSVINSETGTPTIVFEKNHHNFGNINEGEQLEYAFKFTNTGDGDLLITDARATCGCTVPRWPTYPIKPGHSDVIPVQFNTSGRKDAQTKTVTITANTNPAETHITISAFVIPKDQE